VEHQIWPEPAPPEPYTGPDRRKRMPVLGMRLRDFDVAQAADYMLSTQRTQQEGVGLFVTPNIQHIALARDDVEFATAMKSAQIIVADGFPVYRFAKARGLYLPGRITGREVIEDMFSRPERLAGHRGYFVVDSEETATRVEAWTAQAFPGLAVHTHVPPFGFEHDVEASTALAIDINAFETSLLFMCVGAPKSEVFVHRHRALLRPCWALCVGQSFRLLVGMNTPPPAIIVRLNLEWLWRIAMEPGRMIRRYVPSMIGFLHSVAGDLRWNRKRPAQPINTQNGDDQ
jgi:N-acetylglucosaminyldiphosphoundecaprenol N-acetyl-beta-D-mannosaminyltransferase